MESPLSGKIFVRADHCDVKILYIDDDTLLNVTRSLCVLFVPVYIGQ